jgi:hydrogenase nickel incorporation protein HypA/HybF
MHELSLCQAIVDAVVEHADGRPVRAVHLRIGHLRGVVPDSLHFAWEVLTDGTDLDGSDLLIDHVPAVLTCRACGTTSTLDQPLLLCPACISDQVDVVSGEEFQLAAIDVAEGVI